jgi:hypothetical protein
MRPPTADERLARIEERMATRDDVDALRALLERQRPGWTRWAGGALFGVRYRVQPFFGRGDLEDLRKLFDMLQERLQRLRPTEPEPELEVPDSNLAL